MKYIQTIYNNTPYTEYPFQLCQYLYNRFNFSKGIKLLDIGCGRCEHISAFQKLGLKVWGIDKEKIDIHGLFFIKYIDIEKEKFDYPNNYFDVIFSKSVLEHFYNSENFIKECYRVLKPNGKIIILTPDWCSQIKIFYNDYTHRHPYDKNSLKNLLKIFNFKNVDTEIFYQLPVLWKHPFLKIISKFLQLFVSANSKIKNKFIRWSVELMILGIGTK